MLERGLEHGEQREVGRGRHLVVPLHLLHVALAHLLDGLMHEHAHLDDAGVLRGLDATLDVREVGARDGRQRHLRPRGEPVDCAVVHEGGELADAVAVRFRKGRHGEDDVDLRLDLLHEGPVQVGLGDGDFLLLELRGHLLEDGRQVRVVKEVGHLAGREDIVDVLEKELVDDLSVREEEGDVLALVPRERENLLEVVAPITQAVGLRDFDHEELVFADVHR
mmetsp:Transcript_4456/g.13004  ORF Transcript_4456/g.13004 Transcript_4456/m.13004 type:complete len:222 (-) Transcript_4456:1864-2529(-)